MIKYLRCMVTHLQCIVDLPKGTSACVSVVAIKLNWYTWKLNIIHFWQYILHDQYVVCRGDTVASHLQACGLSPIAGSQCVYTHVLPMSTWVSSHSPNEEVSLKLGFPTRTPASPHYCFLPAPCQTACGFLRSRLGNTALKCSQNVSLGIPPRVFHSIISFAYGKWIY